MSSAVSDLMAAAASVVARSASPTIATSAKHAVYENPDEFREEPDEELDLRQLRHHTKNALQRILALIAQAPGLHDTPEGERIAIELEQRIQLSATISNALFGLTRAPGSMTDRLRSLGESVIDLLREPTQSIRLDVAVRGQCPTALRETVLRVAHELIGNSVKHGMRGRREGRISIRLDSGGPGRTRLTITDNGRGFTTRHSIGEGLSVARGLAEQQNGSLRISSDEGTVAVLELPHEDAKVVLV